MRQNYCSVAFLINTLFQRDFSMRRRGKQPLRLSRKERSDAIASMTNRYALFIKVRGAKTLEIRANPPWLAFGKPSPLWQGRQEEPAECCEGVYTEVHDQGKPVTATKLCDVYIKFLLCKALADLSRSLSPQLAVQNALAYADVFGSYFQKFVVGDKFKALFKAHALGGYKP